MMQLHNGFEYNNESSAGYAIRLDDSGLRVWHDHIPRKTAVVEAIDYLYGPGKILENIILALLVLIEASGKNKEKVKSFCSLYDLSEHFLKKMKSYKLQFLHITCLFRKDIPGWYWKYCT
jgi:hypothetical protein